MAAKLLSLYLLAVVGLGIVNAGTPSPNGYFIERGIDHNRRAAPLELRQSNQTCLASQNKLTSDLKQMHSMLAQLSMQMHGYVLVSTACSTVNGISGETSPIPRSRATVRWTKVQ